MPIQASLQDIKDWGTPSLCVPRAFAAVTGLTPTEAAAIIAARARQLGASVTDAPTQGFATRHWYEAIGDIGGHPSKVDVAEPYPLIADYIRAPVTQAVHFGVGVHPDGADTHVFACGHGFVVDEYTNGLATDVASAVPTGRFAEYLVKYAILLR